MKTKEKIMYGFYEDWIMICDLCKKKYIGCSDSQLISPLRKYLSPEIYHLCPKCFRAIENKIQQT